MHYKILCSDLDGTLLSTKSDVSDYTIAEINRIKEKTRIILVSARMPKAMTYIQERLGITNEVIICYNGALMLDQGTELFSTIIDIDHIKELNLLAKQYHIKLGLYYKDEWYVESHTDRVEKEIHHTRTVPTYQPTHKTLDDWETRRIGAHKLMLMGTKSNIDELLPKLEVLFKTSMNLYRSNDTLIEATPQSISKLSAIEHLLKDTGSLKDVIAFGDNYNDKQMLEQVHFGVAVANAREEVKEIADFVTLTNTDDGVAHFLNLHFNI